MPSQAARQEAQRKRDSIVEVEENLLPKVKRRLTTLRTRLELVVHELGGATAAARKLGLEPGQEGRIRKWCKGGGLNVESAIRLSEATGKSIDWLCGYDVPEDRRQREQVGALQGALRDHLREVCSVGARQADRLLPPGSRLLEEVVEIFEQRMRGALGAERRMLERGRHQAEQAVVRLVSAATRMERGPGRRKTFFVGRKAVAQFGLLNIPEDPLSADEIAFVLDHVDPEAVKRLTRLLNRRGR